MHKRHILPVSIAEAQKLILPVNKPLASALGELARFERPTARRTATRHGPYLAHYSYGQLLAGPDTLFSSSHLGGFLPPCGNRPDACNLCRASLAEVGDERPLCVVLSHIAEEFLENHIQDLSRGHLRRFSANRLVKMGEYVNLAETLNSLVDPEFPKGAFRAPVRCASAGIRSAHLTVPVGNKDLKLALHKSWKSTLENGPDMTWNTEWEDRDFLKAAAEIGLTRAQSSWELQALVIPISWLRTNLYSRGVLRDEGKDILLRLLAAGWKESRGLRSTAIRQMTLGDAGRGLPGHITAEQIVSRLLLILRGDAPGFRPAVLNDEGFPMTAIWQTLIGDEQIRKRFFADRFPGIIEPFHLNRRGGIAKGTFFYYPLTSFDQLNHHEKSVDELDTIEAVNKLLRELQDKNPDMLGRIEWEFFASPAPLESKLTKARSEARRTRNILVPFASAELSEVIHKDFDPQLLSASNFGPVPDKILSRPPRKGFLRRFIRVSIG